MRDAWGTHEGGSLVARSRLVGGLEVASGRACKKWDRSGVKNSKAAPEPKTPGTVAVEKHRPLLNKLSETPPRRLRQRAAALLYGHDAPAPGR